MLYKIKIITSYRCSTVVSTYINVCGKCGLASDVHLKTGPSLTPGPSLRICQRNWGVFGMATHTHPGLYSGARHVEIAQRG
jgi:hypothetical protein